jgi:hypothetical protein
VIVLQCPRILTQAWPAICLGARKKIEAEAAVLSIHGAMMAHITPWHCRVQKNKREVA